MLNTSLVQILLVLAALGHFVTIPALAFALRWAILNPAELRLLSPFHRALVLVLLVTVQCVLLGSAATVLWARADILAGGKLATATTGCLAMLWLARMSIQVRLYGPLFKNTKFRRLHWGLVALFAFMGAAYSLACARAAQPLVGG